MTASSPWPKSHGRQLAQTRWEETRQYEFSGEMAQAVLAGVIKEWIMFIQELVGNMEGLWVIKVVECG